MDNIKNRSRAKQLKIEQRRENKKWDKYLEKKRLPAEQTNTDDVLIRSKITFEKYTAALFITVRKDANITKHYEPNLSIDKGLELATQDIDSYLNWIKTQQQKNIKKCKSKSAFGKLSQCAICLLNILVNEKILQNILTLYISDEISMNISELLSFQKILASETNSQIIKQKFLIGDIRLIMRCMYRNRHKIQQQLVNIMLINKWYFSQIEPFMNIWRKTICLSICTSSLYKRIDGCLYPVTVKIKCQTDNCDNNISLEDSILNYTVDYFRNDDLYHNKCPECLNLPICMSGIIPAKHYTKCFSCSSYFYIAYEYKGRAAKCSACR